MQRVTAIAGAKDRRLSELADVEKKLHDLTADNSRKSDSLFKATQVTALDLSTVYIDPCTSVSTRRS